MGGGGRTDNEDLHGLLSHLRSRACWQQRQRQQHPLSSHRGCRGSSVFLPASSAITSSVFSPGRRRQQHPLPSHRTKDALLTRMKRVRATRGSAKCRHCMGSYLGMGNYLTAVCSYIGLHGNRMIRWQKLAMLVAAAETAASPAISYQNT